MVDSQLILLGKRVREMRSRQGLSQERLSELCGISSRHISEIERGESNPSFQVMARMAQALDIALVDLLNFEHHQNCEDMQKAIMVIVKGLPPEKLRMAYRMLTIIDE